MKASRITLAMVLALASGGCVGGDVIRVVDGVEQPGRFIAPSAYAAYARGAEQEARAQYRDALASYAEAAERDPASVEALTRVGAMRCQLGEDPEASFAEAEDVAADYEPLWRARALCAQRREDFESALAHARRAVSLDPLNDEAVLVFATVARQAGHSDEAGRWLRTLSLRSRSSPRVWQAVATHAEAVADSAWRRHAEHELRRLAGRVDVADRVDLSAAADPTGRRGAIAAADVEAAIRRGDVDAARGLARRAGLDDRHIALRAILAGRVDIAVTEARLRARAEPDDLDARIVLAAAADLAGDHAAADAALKGLPDSPWSPLARLLFAHLLARHAGRDVAEAWFGGPLEDQREALRRQLELGPS